MQVNKWPPPPEVETVLAKVEGVWIQVRVLDEPAYNGSEVEPISLDFHGCGCCGRSVDTPTHWIAMPVAPRDYHR